MRWLAAVTLAAALGGCGSEMSCTEARARTEAAVDTAASPQAAQADPVVAERLRDQREACA